MIRSRPRTWLWIPLAFVAFRSLYLGATDVELALFDHEAKSPLLAIGVGLSLLWTRRKELAAQPNEPAPVALSVLLACAGGSFFAAQLRGLPSVLLLSLAFHLLAFATARWGKVGLRGAAFPAAAMLLGLPVPAPLESQVLWTLQLWTTAASGCLLDLLSREEVWTSGTTLSFGDRPFLVIEACSGLSGIEILTSIALVIREFFRMSGARIWLVVVAAPPFAFALNVVRVCWIATLPTSQAEPGHIWQGLTVLMAGTVLLYLLAWVLAGREEPGQTVVPASSPAGSGPRMTLWACALAGLSFVPAFPARPHLVAGSIGFPREVEGWRLAEEFQPDRVFLGKLPLAQIAKRRYQDEAGAAYVDLFIGAQDVRRSATRLFTDKLRVPGRSWELVSTRETRLWATGIDATLAISQRGDELALSCSWEVGRPSVSDHWRAWAGLAPRSEAPRYVVRLTTPLASTDERAEKRARAIMERFVEAAMAELQRLERRGSAEPIGSALPG